MVFQNNINKILHAFIVLLGVAGLIFLLTASSGNANININGDNLFQQFLSFLSQNIQGNFGISAHYGGNVISIIGNALWVSLDFLLLALLIIVLIGGALIYFTRHKITQTTLKNDEANYMIYFMWAIFLFLLAGVLPVLMNITTFANASLSFDGYFWQYLILGDMDNLSRYTAHMAMPLLAFTIPAAYFFASQLQTAIHDYRQNSHIMIKERATGKIFTLAMIVSISHQLMLSLLKKIHLLFAYLVIIEAIFNYHGIGYLALQAIINHDLILIQTILLLFATFYIISNLLIECFAGEK